MKRQNYDHAWTAFKRNEENAAALDVLITVNGGDGAPHVALFGMRLSGTFSKGTQSLFDKLAKEKYPDPITPGSLNYLTARQRWADWWMRIFQRNIFNVVAKSIASGIRILNSRAATTLRMDFVKQSTRGTSLWTYKSSIHHHPSKFKHQQCLRRSI